MSTENTNDSKKPEKKELTPEEKARANKILKWGCYPILVIIVTVIVIAIVGGDDEGAVEPNQEVTIVEPTYNDPLKLGIDSVKSIVGKPVPEDKFIAWGRAKVIESEDTKYEILYLPIANVAMTVENSSGKILFAEFEVQPAIDYVSALKELRKTQINSQFSAWDGAHIKLERIIKEAMDDPDSYEHVSTQSWDLEDHLVVILTFRGTNMYGAKVKSWVKAKTDIETGEVLEIIEQG